MRLLAFVFVIIAFSSVWGAANGPSRSQAADQSRASSCEHLISDKDPINVDFISSEISYATVKITSSSPGPFGGNLLNIQKTGPTWLSAYTTVGNFDIQGDPRFFIAAVGGTLAEQLGFSAVDENHMIVPDAKEFQARVDLLNDKIKSKTGENLIGIKIKESVPSKTPLMDYLESLAFEKTLLFAAKEKHLVHDISFHTGAIFVPQDLLNIMSTRLRYVVEFIKLAQIKLKADEISEKDKIIVKRALKFLKYLQVHLLDNGFGFESLGLIGAKTLDAKLQKEIRHLLSLQTSTGEYMTPQMTFSLIAARLGMGVDAFETLLTIDGWNHKAYPAGELDSDTSLKQYLQIIVEEATNSSLVEYYRDESFNEIENLAKKRRHALEVEGVGVRAFFSKVLTELNANYKLTEDEKKSIKSLDSPMPEELLGVDPESDFWINKFTTNAEKILSLGLTGQ